MDALRKEGQADTNQSVGTHLQQYTRQDHAHLGWSVGMRIRQPGMEGEHRYFDSKGQEDQQEGQQLQAHRQACERDIDRPVEHMF